MLIFVVLIIIAVISLLISFKTLNKTITPIICGVSLALLLILSIMAIGVHITEPTLYESNKQLYNSLTYQLEHDIYDNDNDIGKFKLYEKITDWNADLATGKVMQDNIWFGAFWHNYYDEFEFIEFPEGG